MAKTVEMDIGESLDKIRAYAAKHGKTVTFQEAVFILSEITERDYTNIILNKKELLSQGRSAELDRMLKEMFIEAKPLDKITNRSYFFGLELYTDEDVMTPRKETEILAEKVIGHIKENGSRKFRILDLCTGSGCIAIAVAMNCDIDVILATDISEKALAVADNNIKRYMLCDKIKTVRSDMFDVVNEAKFDIIISNPPYISDKEYEMLDAGVTVYDPAIALKGGCDGLDFYRRIFADAHRYLAENGSLFCEIDRGQADNVRLIMAGRYTGIRVYRDHSGNDRVMSCRIKGTGEKL